MSTRSYLHDIIPFSIITIMAFFLSSCVKDDPIGMEIPSLNKNTIKVTGKESKDTIYSTNGVDCKLNNIEIVRAKGRPLTFQMEGEQNAEIKDGDQNIGRIEYKNGEIAKVEIYDWCTLTVIRKNKSYAYIIEAKGGKVPTTKMYLTIPGIIVTIS